MASITSSPSPSTTGFLSPRVICQIVGYTCLLGFVVDFLVLVFPPSVMNPQWRLGMLQQVGDRSIVLLFGIALVIAGLNSRRWLKQLSRLSLVIGILYFLFSPLVIIDTVRLQQNAVNAIAAQATQVQSQIDTAKANPTQLGENVTLADLERASSEVAARVEQAEQNAVTASVKAGVKVVGNLIVMGLGFVGLGRYAMSVRR